MATKTNKASTHTPAATPAAQLQGFFTKRNPAVVRIARAARAKLRERMPAAIEFIYDKRNSLVLGYGPTERPSDAIVSIVLFSQWVTLCFIDGVSLTDPEHLLRGEGSQVRHIRLHTPDDIDAPAVQQLIAEAVLDATPPFPPTGRGRTLIRMVSAPERS